MDKRILPFYLLAFLVTIATWSGYLLYEVLRHGIEQGIYLTVLTWTMYVLCIPAAHGRLAGGWLVGRVLGRPFFPEPYLWGIAVAINFAATLLTPDLYQKTVPTFMLQRIFMTPVWWVILLLGTMGCWYRSMVGPEAYLARRTFHTLVRHLLTLVGMVVFFYLTHADFIILLNALADG